MGEEEEEEEDPRPTSNAVLRVALTLCVILQVSDGWGHLILEIYFSFFNSFVNLEYSLVWFGFITGSCKKECLKVQFAAHQTIHE